MNDYVYGKMLVLGVLEDLPWDQQPKALHAI